MTALKALTFAPLPSSNRNPADRRRAKTITRLEEQKRLIDDPTHVRTVKRWVKIDGKKSLMEKQQRVYPWWRPGPNGSYVFFIRLGGRPIEFEKGKAGIAVPAPEKMHEVIDTLIEAVRAGELDDQLAQTAGKSRPVPKTKKSAA